MSSRLIVCTLLAASACHSTPAAPDDGNAGVASNAFKQASHTPVPLLHYGGGGLIIEPKIVTITFGGDPLKDRLELLGDTLGDTDWWTQITDGYCVEPAHCPCVGKASGGGHAVLPNTFPTSTPDGGAPFAGVSDSDIRGLIQGGVTAGTIPQPTPSTIYMVYLPDGVPFQGGACAPNAFNAYHDVVLITPKDGTTPVQSAYGPIMRCRGESGTTSVASHEIGEATTDPTFTDAFIMKDTTWSYLPYGISDPENGDLCFNFFGPVPADSSHPFEQNYSVLVPPNNFTLQRMWSNKSARAGHDPCVPIPPRRVYFNAAPAANQKVIHLAVGESQTIDVTAFSDGPKASWTLSAIDHDQFAGAMNPTPSAPALSFSFDKTQVSNGSQVKLTIKLLKLPTIQHVARYSILSTDAANVSNFWTAAVVPK